ncbi:MAG TPA: ferrous iron transport protein B [Dictyoglomaceae bacterium]|nr:ferrous iron transport protein B [Dictyoglomaceae bacterium]HOL39493.1 ferrous iron transport protein B [Dictyoglomaceae bacterium]HPP15366.1 ferrous iron transport protein B [Dictyoglomaceae bacterium]
MEKTKIRVALAGNPNVGKSTLFNQLTGLNQHTGNWPGKTVEKKVGYVEKDSTLIEITDLPGTYSLTAHSIEEVVAREFIIKEKPDITVVVLDASALERNLYLLLQIMELSSNVIVVLNMLDILKEKKYKLDTEKLQQKLGVPVISTIASKGIGIDNLVEKIIDVYKNKNLNPMKIEYPELEDTLKKIEALLPEKIEEYPKRWAAIKLLEGDPLIVELCKKYEGWEEIKKIVEKKEENPVKVASARYSLIKNILKDVLEKPTNQVITWTDRLDDILTHRIWGLPIAILIIFSIFYFTYSLKEAISTPWDNFLGLIGLGLNNLFSFLPEWLKNLLIGGIWQGVANVLSFTPLIVIFFFFLALLEDTGYLARLAFVTDRIMHILGLHGKAFIPLVMSFGCNVPGVMATRTLENEKDRLLLIMVNSFIPCVPRILVASFFLSIFFPKYAPILLLVLYLISFLSIMISGRILQRRVLKTSFSPLLMELPLYKLPNIKIVSLYVWDKLKSFLVRAGTVMVILSGITWILSHIPSGNIENSILANIGKTLMPLFSPLGFNWQLTTGLISGFVAKEASLSTLGSIYGASGNALGKLLLKDLSPITAFSFLVFQLLYIPCAATIATIYKETNSLKWTLITIFYSLTYAYLFTLIIHTGITLLVR